MTRLFLLLLTLLFSLSGPAMRTCNDFGLSSLAPLYLGAMAKTVLPKAYNKWFYWLTTMAARNSIGTQLSKRSGVIQFGYSTSGASYVSYGLYVALHRAVLSARYDRKLWMKEREACAF